MPIDPLRTERTRQRASDRPLTISTAPSEVPLATESSPYTAEIVVADPHRTERARG